MKQRQMQKRDYIIRVKPQYNIFSRVHALSVKLYNKQPIFFVL